MSKTGHTAGPWSVEEPMDHELTIVEANRPTHEWRFIALCGFADPDEVHPLSKREVRANARLIAAAPELLDALCALVLNIDAGGATMGAMKDARAVIEKATAS